MATDCPECGTSHYVTESPEAGYWYCSNCGNRGSGHPNAINWWSEDPDSIWFTPGGDS